MTDDLAIYTKRLSAKFNFGKNRKNVDRDFTQINNELSELYDIRV
jgi:hypothetical protein